MFGTYPWERADHSDERFLQYAAFRACYDSGADEGDCAWSCVPEDIQRVFSQLLALDEGSRGTAADAVTLFEGVWVDAVTEMRNKKGKRGSGQATRRSSRSRESRSMSPSFRRITSLFRARSPRTDRSRGSSPMPLLEKEKEFMFSPGRPNFLSPPRAPRPSLHSPLRRECDSAMMSDPDDDNRPLL